jgi:hypothetical protein
MLTTMLNTVKMHICGIVFATNHVINFFVKKAGVGSLFLNENKSRYTFFFKEITKENVL